MQSWRAPLCSTPVRARVEIPGSKSLTARALLLSALSSDPSELSGCLTSRDTDLMVQALRQFGVQVRGWGSGSVVVSPPPRLASDLPLAFIDCGLAGTVMRFVPVVAALAEGTFRFSGDDRAAQRPLAPLFRALQELGVDLETPERGSLPFTIRSSGVVQGGELSIDAHASSQFVSALLLAAPRFQRGLDLSAVGEVPSAPHIHMTVAALQERGVRVYELTRAGHPVAPGVAPARWRVEPGRIQGGRFVIEPDLSNAGPFLGAAGICGGEVTIPGADPDSTQAGKAFAPLLEKMGMEISWVGKDLTARGNGQLQGLDADLSDVGELVPTLAALAAYARTPSVFRGIGHLRGHETDRLQALASELGRVGVETQVEPDALRISGGLAPDSAAAPAPLRSYADHRMATFAALIGLRRPVELDDIACTSKTFPTFPQLWGELCKGELG